MELRRLKRGTAGHPLIELVQPVMYGVIRLQFDDGYEAVLDLRPLMGKAIWKDIRTRDEFFSVQIDEIGCEIYWGEEGGEMALPADGCRLSCEKQARLIKAMDDRKTAGEVTAILERLDDN